MVERGKMFHLSSGDVLPDEKGKLGLPKKQQ